MHARVNDLLIGDVVGQVHDQVRAERKVLWLEQARSIVRKDSDKVFIIDMVHGTKLLGIIKQFRLNFGVCKRTSAD